MTSPSPVDHFQGRAGVIDEQALAGDVGLPQSSATAGLPRPDNSSQKRL